MAGQSFGFGKMSVDPPGHIMVACDHIGLYVSLSLSIHQTAMEAMGLIAIIVNCYLIGQCGQLQRLFPWLSPEMTIISIVLLEVCAVLCLVKFNCVHGGFCSFLRL